jgi:hypothetical protein
VDAGLGKILVTVGAGWVARLIIVDTGLFKMCVIVVGGAGWVKILIIVETGSVMGAADGWCVIRLVIVDSDPVMGGVGWVIRLVIVDSGSAVMDGDGWVVILVVVDTGLVTGVDMAVSRIKAEGTVGKARVSRAPSMRPWKGQGCLHDICISNCDFFYVHLLGGRPKLLGSTVRKE